MSRRFPVSGREGVVIAVSGPPGSGKTTLTRALVGRCPGSARVDWDSYETFTERPTSDIRRWLADGARPDAIAVPGLGERIATLRRTHVVLFETPFGRTHPETARYIDVSLWLEIPPDLALARKLTALLDNALPVEWLRDYLESYRSFVHQALSIQRARLEPAAEIRIDATATAAHVTDAAVAALDKRLGIDWREPDFPKKT